MRKVRCHECGKSYDFDVDDFCPNCGAFTQPARSSQIGADGSVIRVDGLNERGHKGSFVHRELHAEDRVRRAVGLEQSRQRKARDGRQVQRDGSLNGKGKPHRFSGFIAVVIFLIIIQLLNGIIRMFF